MVNRVSICILFLSFIIAGCTQEFECADPQIQPAFIGFSSPDIDTFVIRKFKANGNYQTLLDTSMFIYGYSGPYYTSNDTTSVWVSNEENGIKAGFDWQIFIPAKNKTVFISDINSEKTTGTCRTGIFSMDKFGCHCRNKVFSAKENNQVIHFSNSDTGRIVIYIRN